MPSQPKIRLSYLRDIGWSTWDPIKLLENGQNWRDVEYANEYDSYLIHVAGQLRRGAAREEMISYLADIEINYMGLGVRSDTVLRAERTISEIANSDHIWNFP